MFKKAPQRPYFPRCWSAFSLFVLLATMAADADEHSADVTAANASASTTVSLSAVSNPDNKFETALDTLVDVDFQDTPLTEMATYFAEKLGVEVALDEKALKEANISTDVKVTIRLQPVSASAAFAVSLRDVDLTYCIVDERLEITTLDVAADMLTEKIYPVADLIGDPLSPDFDSLIETITTSIASSTWDFVGGPGSVAPVYARSALIVSQGDDVHRQVQGLLQALRLARAQEMSGNRRQILAMKSPQRERTDNIYSKLGDKCSHSRVTALLPDILNLLSDRHGIPFIIDRRALDEDNIKHDALATLEGENVTLRTMMNRLCRPLGMNWTVVNEAILLTTNDTAADQQRVVIYPVSDLLHVRTPQATTANHNVPRRYCIQTRLVEKLTLEANAKDKPTPAETADAQQQLRQQGCGGAFSSAGGCSGMGCLQPTPEEMASIDGLIESTLATVAPQSWDAVGGPGSTVGFLRPEVLVVAQSTANHERIRQVLADLRTVPTPPALTLTPDEETPPPLATVVYGIESDRDGVEETLAEIIRTAKLPDVWDVESTWIKAYPGFLVVRHQPDVHRQIETILSMLHTPETNTR